MKWSGGHSTPVGNRGKGETPEELAPRRLSFLPTESEGPQRKGTDLFKYPNQEIEYSCFRKINYVFFVSASLKTAYLIYGYFIPYSQNIPTFNSHI